MNKQYTIISDPGIDDLVALTFLSKELPDAKNTLISTFGNAREEITSRNAQEFICFAAPTWNFMHGSKIPFLDKIEHPWPDYFHGPDAVWGVHPDVEIENIRTIDKVIPETLLSLATLTDPLKLFVKGKTLEVTIMGGAFQIEGNETKYAETNIAFDPNSAAQFFGDVEYANIQVVPLDVSRKVMWSKEKVASIPEKNEINIWLKKLLLAWFENYNHDKEKDFNLHDPLATYLMLYPEKAEWIASGVEVVTKGEERGRTIFSNKNPKCRVAMGLKNEEAISNAIFSKIFED